jgi:hypothetical protein
MKKKTDGEGEILNSPSPPEKDGLSFAKMVGRLLKEKQRVLGIVMAILAGVIVLLIAAAIFIVHLLGKIRVVEGEINWTFVFIAFLIVVLIGMLLVNNLVIKGVKAIWWIITSEKGDESVASSNVPSTKPTTDKPAIPEVPAKTSTNLGAAIVLVLVVGLLLLLLTFLFYQGLPFAHPRASKIWLPEKNQTTKVENGMPLQTTIETNGNKTSAPTRGEPPEPPRPTYPLSGDKGNVVPIMYDCYYSAGDVVTCKGSAQNNDDVAHGVYLMDSQGVFSTPTGGGQFSVWTFGGSLQFVGGTDFVQVIPGMSSPFVFSFRENTGRAEHVGITLYIKTAADSINHPYTFANIPVVDHRS